MIRRWDPTADILAASKRPDGDQAEYPKIDAVPGLTLLHQASRVSGVLVRYERNEVEVRQRDGRTRVFRATPGAFQVAGQAVTLIRPAAQVQDGPALTASGSRPVPAQRARVARDSRILVEGVHDAELVERVWGDDLQVEGVVVGRLDGIDHLADTVRVYRPRPGHWLGVLLDHLIPGSKEARLAAAVSNPHILITGTPFVDVWEAVKPSTVGISHWPIVPKGRDWKNAVCQQLGLGPPAEMWRRILGSIGSYADLEPQLVGAVEQLIDFVTEPT